MARSERNEAMGKISWGSVILAFGLAGCSGGAPPSAEEAALGSASEGVSQFISDIRLVQRGYDTQGNGIVRLSKGEDKFQLSVQPEGSYAIYSTLAPNLSDLWFWNQGRCHKAGTWLAPYWDCPAFETDDHLDAHLLPGTQVVTFYSYYGVWPNTNKEVHDRWATQTITIPPLGTPPGGFDQGQLFRYYNASTGDHFYTTSWYELGPGINGWAFEQVAAHVGQRPGTVPFYRFANGHSHFYSTNLNEGTNAGFSQEGTAGYVYTSQVPNSVPLYRYYNAGLDYHFYTTNIAELGNANSGFTLEGIAAYVPADPPNSSRFAQWSTQSASRVLDDDSKTWLADVNGDGKVDLITQGGPTSPSAGRVCVGLSDGSQFTQWSFCSAGRMLDDNSKTWVADVNGDGKADLISQGAPGLWNAGYVYVGLSNGSGFAQWSSASTGRVIDDNSKTWVADVNGDGKADLISQGAPGLWNAGYVYVGLSNGSGFAQWSSASTGRVIDDNSKTWVADVNGDGKADLVSQGAPGLWNAGYVYVGLSNGSGFAQWSSASTGRVIDDNSKTWVADVNGDGKADLVSQGAPGLWNAGYVYVGLSNGNGFTQWTSASSGRVLDDDSKVSLADINGDGKADLIAQGARGLWNAGYVYVGLSNGSGFNYWTSSSTQRVIDDDSKTWFADVNGNGKLDLVSQGAPGLWNAGYVYVGLSTP